MKKIKQILIILIIICSSINIKGQYKKLDSLWKSFNQAKHDTTRIKLYLDIGDMYEYEKSDTALFYYNKALSLADKNLDNPLSSFPHSAETFMKIKATSLRYIGIVNRDQGNYNKALKFFFKSLKIFEKLGDKKGMANCHNYIGSIHFYQGNYDKAIEYFLKSLKTGEELGDKKGMSVCYTNIGNVHFEKGNYNEAIDYYLKSLKISEESGDKQGMSTCCTNIGNVQCFQGKYDKAIEYYLKSLNIDKELGDKKGMLLNYICIGIVHSDQGSYDRAIEYYLKSLKISEELGDKEEMAMCYGNIGNVHFEQGSYDKALGYYLKSLEILEVLDDKQGMSACYLNIGRVHSYQGSYVKAKEFFLKSLKISEKLGDKKGISNCCSNIGAVYHEQGSYDKALKYYLKSLKIDKELSDKNAIAIVYKDIARLHILLADSTINQGASGRDGHLKQAMEYGNKAYNLSVEIGTLPIQNDAAAVLQKAYTKMGKYKEAIKWAEIYISTNDSMFTKEKTKALAEMSAKYESEKKQLEIEKMQKQKELDDKTIEVQTAENRKQLIIIISSISGFFIVLVFSFIILRMFRQKRKANILLASQNAEIRRQKEAISAQRDEIEAQRDTVVKQKDHIEEQKQEITDSINYAKRIQYAVLPTGKYANTILGEHFILFRPKSIVSGDFYWGSRVNEWLIVTVADCTGHGVPGAFMSMLGVSFLNEIVRKKEVTKASDILDHLRISVIDALQQKGQSNEQKDGMDIALCAINMQTNLLHFAGANNPLFIVTALKELKELKPDRQPVAIYEKMKPFTNQEIQLNKGDCIYLASDGYEDQFGGPNNEKFKIKKLRELLINTAGKPMHEQKEILNQTFEDWKGEHEQIDDVTMLGLKI